MFLRVHRGSDSQGAYNQDVFWAVLVVKLALGNIRTKLAESQNALYKRMAVLLLFLLKMTMQLFVLMRLTCVFLFLSKLKIFGH